MSRVVAVPVAPSASIPLSPTVPVFSAVAPDYGGSRDVLLLTFHLCWSRRVARCPILLTIVLPVAAPASPLLSPTLPVCFVVAPDCCVSREVRNVFVLWLFLLSQPSYLINLIFLTLSDSAMLYSPLSGSADAILCRLHTRFVRCRATRMSCAHCPIWTSVPSLIIHITVITLASHCRAHLGPLPRSF